VYLNVKPALRRLATDPCYSHRITAIGQDGSGFACPSMLPLHCAIVSAKRWVPINPFLKAAMKNLAFDFSGGKSDALVLDVETQFLSDEIAGAGPLSINSWWRWS